MADTIKLPGFGPTKKTTAYAIGAGVLLVGGIAWYRSKNAAAAAPVDTTAAADQIDPATGFAYGSAEDTNALAGQGFSYSGGGGSSDGGSSGGGSGGGSTAGAYTTNGQWSQAAEDYLVNTVGGDANAVGNALGKYITGQALTADQVGIVEQAIAFTGYPPVNGPSGYPPSYRTAAEPPAPAGPLPAPTGLHQVAGRRTTVTLVWDPVPGAARYEVFNAGALAHLAATTETTVTLHHLHPNTQYSFYVRAYGPNWEIGKASPQLHFHTAR